MVPMLKRILLGMGLIAFTVAGYLGWTLAMRDRGATITIDPTRRFQVMSGWEVSARLWEEDKAADRFDGSWLDYKPQLLGTLVHDIGINRVRVELRSGSENPVDYWRRFSTGTIGYQEFRRHRYEKINDNDDPEVPNPAGFQFAQLDFQIDNVVLPMRELLAARSERLFINLCYVDFSSGNQGALAQAESAEEYAELIDAAFRHLRDKYGLTPDSLEIILEPENTLKWRGQQIGRAVVATTRRLHDSQFMPKIIAPSTTHAYAAPNYIDAMMAVPGVDGQVSTFSYHTYSFAPDLVRAMIFRRATAHLADTGMLEHLTGDATELYRDLTVANVSAWQQYGIAHRDTADGTDNGGYLMFVDPKRADGQRIRLGSLTAGLSQYFRYIRAGAVRIGAGTDNSRKKPVAFLNTDGRLTVVVQTEDSGNLKVVNAPPGRFGVQFAPNRGPSRALGYVTTLPNQPLRVRAPERGVLSLFQVAE
jgi:hypothetical protein